MTPVYKFLKGVSWLIMKLFFNFKVENPIDQAYEGPMIICANHRSYFDIPAIMHAYPAPIRFIAKKELDKGLVGWLFRSAGVIFVQRDSSDISSLREILKGLRKDEQFGIFPEGTRVKEVDFKNMKEGVGFLIQRGNCPVLCAHITGKYRFRGKITLTWRPLLEFSPNKELGKREERKEISQKVFKTIYKEQFIEQRKEGDENWQKNEKINKEEEK